jgi:hypothetical protein
LHGSLNKELVEKSVSEVNILIGAKAKSEGLGKEIAIGNCTKRYFGELPFVPGCPPPADAYCEIIEHSLLTGEFPVNTVKGEGGQMKVTSVDDRDVRIIKGDMDTGD